MISHEYGKKKKKRIVIATNVACQWSSMAQIFRDGLPTHGGHLKTFEMMTSILRL